MRIPFWSWVIQGIPECFALATLFYALNRCELNWRKITIIGLVQAALTYIVRLIPFSPGVHIVIMISVLGVLGILFAKFELRQSMMAGVFAMVILGIYEYAIYLVVNSLGVDYMAAWEGSSYIARLIYSLPQVLLLFITGILISKSRRLKMYQYL